MLTTMLLIAAQAAPVPPAPPAPPAERVERMIVVHETGKAGTGAPTIVRRGDKVEIGGCGSERRFETDAEVTREGRKEKTRILLCSKGDESDVAWVERLRSAAKRIEADDNLSPEARTRVVAAINEAIAKAPVRE
ncbi:hypothetical protein GCM10022280_23700 [Sphingomonas swuensis]|uniref:Uncharacterized protein n=1 Tax=Sphingomonas swuensis TaxID=977800 RepID=A0ABP7T839_9SPHN